MFQAIKNWLYRLVVRTGILYRLMPFMENRLKSYAVNYDGANFKVTDAGGATIDMTKYDGKIYPPFGEDRFAGIKSLNIRDDDVIICGYPKTGCHWVYEIVHMIMTGEKKMKSHGKILGGMIEAIHPIFLDSVPSPRVLNTHVLYDDLPQQIKQKKTKIVFTNRCPKDTVASYYNHIKNLPFFYHYNGSFDNYFKLFMGNQIEYGNYFDYLLSWEPLIKDQKDNEIFLMEYEMLKAGPLEMVKKLARFLGISITDEFAHRIVEETDFSKMKKKQPDNKLIRKGKVGDWRNWLTDEQSAQIDQVWKERMMSSIYTTYQS